MKPNDKVLIDCQDGDYGTVIAEGKIISCAPPIRDVPARYCVEYKENNYPHKLVRDWFYESDLKEIK